MNIRAILAACALCVFADAPAADPESYAVVALFGDDLSVVTYQSTTGTSLDRNDQQHIPLADRRYDRLATALSIDEIHKAMPTARVEPLTLPDEVLAGGLDASLPSLLDRVRATLKNLDTHYLVVVSKFRGDAHLKMSNGTIGSGKLAGIGFYIDPVKRMRKTSTGESGRGFVAPFAYLDVTLVDLRTGTVIRSEPATESMTRANVGPATTLDPWDAMTPDEKARALDVVVRRAVLRAVPRVVAPT